MSDFIAQQSILAVLREQPITRINFAVGSVPITPARFHRVADAVTQNKIGVKHVPGLDTAGIYNSTENRFYLRRDILSTIEAKALVVHEACHAGLDIARASQMRTITSEAAAYISQCVYARSKSNSPRTERLQDKDPRKDRVFEIAWDLAGLILDSRKPKESDIERLRQAVLEHPYYSKDGQKVTGFDGVPGM